jgi:uncharacterized protein
LREASPHTELRFPLERLQRLDPIRTWKVEVQASLLQELDRPLQVGDICLPADEIVSVELLIDQVHGGVTVNGKVSVNWNAECSRCLRPVDGYVVAEVEELFEETPRDGESYQLNDEFIDLEPMIRDAVLLELPVGVIRCLGLEECLVAAPAYPVSDTDFGEDKESRESKDPRWAALDDLTFDEE